MKKILVIEDESSIRLNILSILQFEGFEAIEADNGEAGVRLAKEEIPDLILCDIMMPILDGYEVQNELNQDLSTRTIPLVFLTAKAERADMRLAMNLGADDYLTKPFSRNELLETVFSQLDKQTIIHEKFQDQINHIRTNIVTSLPAELFIPIQQIRSFLESLQYQNDTISLNEIHDALAQSYQSTLSLEKLLQNFLLYALLETAVHDPVQAETFRGHCHTESTPVITEIAHLKASEYKRKLDLELDLINSHLPILEANLAKIVEEIIDNAFKFSQPGTTVRITSSVKANTLKLTVSNQGRGLSPKNILDVKYSSQLSERLQGNGGIKLGLAIVKRLIEIHHGKLSLGHDGKNNTEVQINLPVLADNQTLLKSSD